MYLYHFAKGLAEHGRIRLALATDVKESAELRELEERYRIPVSAYGRAVEKGPSVWRYCQYLKAEIRRLRPDIFWEGNNLLPVRMGNPYGKYVVTIHDVFPLAMPDQYGRVYPHYFKYGLGKTIPSCDGILYNSRDTRRQTEARFPEAKGKAPYESYIAVPPIRPAACQREDYFLYVGNLERRKGADILLEAYLRYLQAGGNRALYLAGKIREDAVGRQLREAERTAGTLHYLGYIDRAQRDRRYGECGCFVFPSRAEGFGMPVIEALSCGTDVIASGLPVFREVAGDAAACFALGACREEAVTNLAEALLAFRPAGAAERAAYRRAAERYAPEALVPGVVSYFERLLEKG